MVNKKFHSAAIGLSWPFRMDHCKKIGVTEMRMLRCIIRNILKDIIRIENKMREINLHWFSHMQRIVDNAQIRKLKY